MATASKTTLSPQEMQNLGFDTLTGVPAALGLGYTGRGLQRQSADAMMISVQTSGSDTYVGEAAPGTALSDAYWQAYKVDSSGNVTFADSNPNFDNVATDLTALTYG